MKITHIINPVLVPASSDLYKAQPVTFETMKRARDFIGETMDISLVATCYPEDTGLVPDFFTRTPILERSVMDEKVFSKHRKLPLIAHILERAVAVDPHADYIIYTNVDIGLLPHFYLLVKEKIECGLDAFIINRRTIAKTHTLQSLGAAYSAIGDTHPGFDCFVIRRDRIASFQLGNVCIGANWIGRTLYANLLVYCKNFEIIKDAHATFHIGEDGAWLVSDFSEFDLHNKNQLYEILKKLKEQTTDVLVLAELNALDHFMEGYGDDLAIPVPTLEKVPYAPGRWKRWKKKIKKALKILLDKDGY